MDKGFSFSTTSIAVIHNNCLSFYSTKREQTIKIFQFLKFKPQHHVVVKRTCMIIFSRMSNHIKSVCEAFNFIKLVVFLNKKKHFLKIHKH